MARFGSGKKNTVKTSEQKDAQKARKRDKGLDPEIVRKRENAARIREEALAKAAALRAQKAAQAPVQEMDDEEMDDEPQLVQASATSHSRDVPAAGSSRGPPPTSPSREAPKSEPRSGPPPSSPSPEAPTSAPRSGPPPTSPSLDSPRPVPRSGPTPSAPSREAPKPEPVQASQGRTASAPPAAEEESEEDGPIPAKKTASANKPKSGSRGVNKALLLDDTVLTEEILWQETVKTLSQMLRVKGLPSTGLKAKLIERLMKA